MLNDSFSDFFFTVSSMWLTKAKVSNIKTPKSLTELKEDIFKSLQTNHRHYKSVSSLQTLSFANVQRQKQV